MTSALESNIGLRNVALLAARVYGPKITMPQGLGTGALYTNNIPSPLRQQGEVLTYYPAGEWCYPALQWRYR
jgi:hypothetical protein